MEGTERALGEQHCDGAAPATLGKPISETSRSRWPRQTAMTMAAGWPEGSEAAQGKRVLVRPLAGRLQRSLQTGQCPRRGEAGWGLPQALGTEPSAGTPAAPLSVSKGQRRHKPLSRQHA